MTIKEIVDASKTRTSRWHPSGLDEWSVLEWAACTAGEAGEACNVAKKIKRVDGDLANRQEGKLIYPAVRGEYVHKFEKECADTILYAILAIMRVGGDPEAVLRDVFNTKSEEYGFPERI